MKTIFAIVPFLALAASPCLAGEKRVPDFPSYSETNYGFTLAPELERRILRKFGAIKIVDIQKVEAFTTSFFGIPKAEREGLLVLHVQLSMSGDFGFEAVAHPSLYFAKDLKDPDWSKAREFDVPLEIEFRTVREMRPPKLEEFIRKHAQ